MSVYGRRKFGVVCLNISLKFEENKTIAVCFVAMCVELATN